MKETAATRSILNNNVEYKPYAFFEATDNWSELAPLYLHSIEAYLLDKIAHVYEAAGFSVPAHTPVSYNESKNDTYLESLQKIIGYSRLHKVKGGYEVSIPLIANFRFDPLSIGHSVGIQSNWNYMDAGTKKKIVAAMVKTLRPILGNEFFTRTQPSDTVVPIDDVLRDIPGLLSQKQLQLEINAKPDASIAAGKKALRSFRIISAPLRPAKAGDIVGDTMTQENSADFIQYVVGYRVVTIFATLFVEAECAKVMTNSLDTKSVDQQDVYSWLHYFGAGVADNDWTYTINPLNNIHRDNESNPDYAQAKVRTNADGLLIREDQSILYVPQVNNIEPYSEYMNAYLQSDADSELCLHDVKNHDLRHHNKNGTLRKLPSNTLLYTDNVNNKLVYTNTLGNINVVDLDASLPFSVTHAHLWIEESIINGLNKTSRGQSFSNAMGAYVAAKGVDLAAEFDKFASNDALFAYPKTAPMKNYARMALKDGDLQGFLTQVFSAVTAYAHRNKNSDYEKYAAEENFSWSLLSVNGPIPVLHLLARHFQPCVDYMLANLGLVLSARSVLAGLSEIASMVCLAKYAPKAEEIRIADAKARKNYINPDLGDQKTFVPKGIPLVKNWSLLPHQRKSLNYLKNEPENAILDCPAGGGKTSMILLDILSLLGKKRVTRPLVVTLPHLIKDYVAEANNVTAGRLNVIPIDSSIMRSWGEDKLKHLILNAPINTLVVTSYYFLQTVASRNHVQSVPYCNINLDINLHVEFMRGLGFDGIWVDEIHFAKNPNSGYNQGLRRLMMDIPIKRGASGTLVSNVLSDIAGEFRLFDPTVFGTVSQFADTYGAGTGGSYADGTESDVRHKLSMFCNLITNHRKEWASLLPERHEYFVPVDLTHLQRQVYETVLEATMERIKDFLKANPSVHAKMLSNDEEVVAAIERMLQTQLWRLEQFLAAPDKDESSKGILVKREDILSPKGKAVIDIFNEHEAEKRPGKILVYTSYRESAATIFEQLPPEIKKQTLHFDVQDDPDATVAKFTRDPKYRMLVGSEKNLNTGRNLQFCDTLIRVETIWSPGNLEQGDSRINRPNLKNGIDPRPAIYVYWLCVNRTIDVTKLCRLITKMISAKKFAESDNPKYQALPSLPPVSMSLENIQAMNDFRDPNSLGDYITQGFEPMRQLEQQDYDEYKNSPEFQAKLTPLPDGPILPGAKLLKHIPYCADIQLFGAGQLGLVPLLDYAGAKLHKELFDESEDTEFDATDLSVHTEFGDGIVYGQTSKAVRVRLTNGDKVTIPKMQVFVITKKVTSTKSVRSQLNEIAQLPTLNNRVAHPGAEDVETLSPTDEKPIRKLKQPAPESEAVEDTEEEDVDDTVTLSLTVMNATLMIASSPEDNSDEVNASLHKFGFREVKAYIYTEVKRASVLRALIDQIVRKYKVPQKYIDHMEEVYSHFKQGRTQLLRVGIEPMIEFRQFWREKFKAQPADVLMPYLLLQDDVLYLICDISMHPASRTLRTNIKNIPTVHWYTDDGMYVLPCVNKADVKNKIMAINKEVPVGNLEAVKEGWRDLKPYRAKK